MRWSKNDVIYQILVDRFSPANTSKAKKPVFAGGNIQGIIEHIPYFVDLGVTALWISPIYQGVAYHGYHITDFMKVDKRFGTVEDFKELITKCHEKNIKIMLDFVPNHVSSAHPFFIKAMHENNKAYQKWFSIRKNSYETFMGYEELPKLNLQNQNTRAYIIDVAIYWLSLGVDGIRIDHAIGPSLDFWKEFKKEVKKVHPEKILLGEVWAENMSWKDLKTTKAKNKLLKWITKANSTQYMKDYQEVFDGCLDFTFNKLMREYFFEHEHKNTFAHELVQHYETFDKNFLLPTFLDNHDMDRFYFDCKNKEEYKKAIDLMFKQNQPVIIYYGDESGMLQEKHFKEFSSHGDLQARQPMNFDNMDADLVEFWKEEIAKKKIK